MVQKIRSTKRVPQLGSFGKAGYAATRLLVTASAVALGVPTAASAQVADSEVGRTQDIVVTANRREESVQRVASAITAISGEQLEARGADSFEGFARSVPGLTLNQTTKNRATFNIRGIATNTNGLANTQDPVAVYINDTPVTDTYGAAAQPDLRLFDVERVEILRGPQGTLFGSGSLGGTVRIITNKPDAKKFEAAGRVDLGVSKGGAIRQRYDAMINVPLVEDQLGLRVVGYYRDEEGWVRNDTLGTRNDTVDWGGRAALLWTPSDTLSIKAEAFHQKSDPKEGDNWNPAVGEFRKASPISEGRRLELTNYNLSLDYQFDQFADLTISSTYQTSKTALNVDLGQILGAGTPNFISKVDPIKSRFYVQEARLISNTTSPFQWVAGLFYINRKTQSPDYRVYAPGLDALFGGLLGSDTYFSTDITTRSTEFAGYGDASLELAAGLKLRGGVRVFHTMSDYSERGRSTLNFATFSYDTTPNFSNQSDGTHTTWRAGISYEPRAGLMLYSNVSKGFRVGQVNASFGPSAVNPADYVIPVGYEPDTTINYEAGVKSSFLDGRVILNLAGFYIDWKNIQIDGTRISDFSTFIANAGSASVKGLEFETNVRPTNGLSLYGTVTVQDGRIDSVPTNIIVPAAVGDRLPGLARWKLSGGFEYRWNVGGKTEAYVRADGQFTDASPNTFARGGFNPLYALNSEYETLDASIGLDTEWGDIALYGENLTNNNAVILKNLSAANAFTTLRPRTFGVRVRVHR